MPSDEHLLSGEKQLKEFTKFLQTHDNKLNKLLATQSLNSIDTGTAWPLSANHKSVTTLQCRTIGIDLLCDNESISIVEMVSSDNKCLNKTIIVFVQLCTEVRKLIKESETLLTHCVYADEDLFILMNGNDLDEDEERIEGTLLTANILCRMGEFLDLITRIEHFIERCIIVIGEIIKQLSSLFAPENKYYVNVNSSSLHFQTVFNYLAESLVLIIKFDAVLKNGQFHILWPYFEKAIRLTEQNFDVLNEKKKYDKDEITGLRNIIQKTEYLFTIDLFQSLIDSMSNKRAQIGPQAMIQFSKQFHSYLQNGWTEINAYLILAANPPIPVLTTPTTIDLANSLVEARIDSSKDMLKLNTMAILYHHLLGNLDQKLFNSIVDCNMKIVCIPLAENLLWSPYKFFAKYGSTLLSKSKTAKEKMTATNIERLQQNWLQAKCQRLVKDTQVIYNQIIEWTFKMRIQFAISHEKSKLNVDNDLIERFTEEMFLTAQGIELMDQLCYLIDSITRMHAHLKCPMIKVNIFAICKSIELLKSMKLTFEQHATSIAYVAQCLSQFYIHQSIIIISNVINKLINESSKGASYDNQVVDILSALKSSESALMSTPTLRRILIARMALNLTDPLKHFTSDQLSKIIRYFAAIEYLLQIKDVIKSKTTSSFMYWHHEAMYPYYQRYVLDANGTINYERIAYFYQNAFDFHTEMTISNKIPRLICVEKFMNETMTEIRKMLISKLCGSIETKLRLDVHASLQALMSGDSGIPAISASTDISVGELSHLLNLHPLSIISSSDKSSSIGVDNHYLSIREHIGIYLSQMFYNLTTVSMLDWRTYGQMRNIARNKFQIQTIEDQLPTQTLEQGLDVLEIMRNIHQFVSKYLYNMNNQIFIEKYSNNKHLNTINIRHIANSLRSHGIGIINTTVNFTYQFLHKKFYAFSQFLYNEQIQSRLMKDLKWFHDENAEKPEEQHIYNFERASSFNKGIRRLGMSENGQSLLDLFRQLITHIGNAMGYVRMMRSGGIHCTADASIFLPTSHRNLNINELCVAENLANETSNAAKNVEATINRLRSNYAEGTDYFKLLVHAFSPFFCNDKNAHLKLFYFIVPPLTINFVEYMVSAKEKLNKKSKQDGWFTDDGFAMGIAYILRLLNQHSDFNSLHWFKAVRQKFLVEIRQLESEKAKCAAGVAANGSESYEAKRQQTLALSEKRIHIYLQEFDLLYCNLSSAKIFFQF